MSSLLLVGCGNMGGAMLARFREKMPANISEFLVVNSKDALPETTPDIIVFAVKPQKLAEILPEYKARFGVKPLYISIAAGKTLAFFEGYLGADAVVVRTMPNTPAIVGKAVTALCANENVSPEQKKIATALMSAIGMTIWVAEENMDAVTAVSGSGPAYVFLFLEALSKAGVSAGLDAELAKTIVLETLHGSIHLAAKSSESYEKLRQNVTSKGGTTEAALGVLMHENAFAKLIEDAVLAAMDRAKKLADKCL